MSASGGILRALRRLAARGREPWCVLLPLLAIQWVALVLFAFSVDHNGWLYYQGGDQIWYWTTSWLAGHGLLATTLVSPGWPLALVPISLVAGPGYVGGLPGPVFVQVLVLAPIALYCVYDVAARIGGRIVGYLAALLWTLGPYLAIPLFVHRYHDKYVDQFLPHALGLTGMADYAGTVALLVAAACILRAYQGRDVRWAILAGLATGFAFQTKASNLLFVAVPVLLFLIGRRWRELGALAVAAAPALGALTLWKYRGYGYLPAFRNAYEETRLALGGDTLLRPYHRYAEIDWNHLHNNVLGLGEVFWSVRVLEWLPLAGAIAVARRAPALAVAFSVWFWLYFVIKGSDSVSSVDSGSFFRLLLPAVPALLIMVASLPLLVPRYGPTLAERFPAAPPRRVATWVIVVAAVVFSLVPLVAAAALRQVVGYGTVVKVNEIEVPVDPGIDLRAEVKNSVVRLRWRPVHQGGTRVFYRVTRISKPRDIVCPDRSGGASRCFLVGHVVRRTRSTEATDTPPRPGRWIYRVGVGANWLDDPELGDVFLVSRPVHVIVR